MSNLINREAALAAVADAIADGRNVYRALADVPVVGALRRMTCREWMQRNRPEDCDADYDGGVRGCPSRYWPGRVRRLCNDGRFNCEICGDCWDQPCPEGGADDAAD